MSYIPRPFYLYRLLQFFALDAKEFLNENYHASRGGHFKNASEARVSTSFAHELPHIFGKVDSSTSGVPLSFTHPLPSMKSYQLFNSPDTHSGIKQTILHEIDNIFDSISSDITSCHSSFFVALMLANTLLVQSKAIIHSLLTWIESFYQKLQAGDQSSPKYTWLLVCSCVHYYTKALHKFRAPTQVASNMSSQFDRAGAYFWAISQSHRVPRVFVAHRWREHPAVSGVINYHLFRFVVPLNAHNRLKLEFEAMKKLDKDRQAEISKLVTRLKFLEGNGNRKSE